MTVIGGGPVGLFAVYYAGLRGMRVKVIDSLPQTGGQLAALYPDKYIFDVPGYTKVLARDLVAALDEQARQFEPQVCLKEKVTGLRYLPEGPIALTTDKGEHLTQSVVIACGVGAFMPRKLDIQSATRLEGRGLFYYVQNRELFRNKRLLIVGGGDSAIDAALDLQSFAQELTVINKFDRWQAHEQSVSQLLSSPARVLPRYEILEVHGAGHVEGVTIIDNGTGDQKTLEIDAIILFIGFLTNLGPIKDWGLALESNGILVNSNMETNLPHVYCAGDIAMYPGKLKLIATGTGEAAIAANNAKAYIDPGAKFFPGHSSQREDLHRPVPPEIDGKAVRK